MRANYKSASLYKFKKKNQYLVHSLSSLQMGVGIASEPFIWIDANEGLETLVEQMFIALNNNKSGLDNPSDWKEVAKDFLKKAGLISKKELHDDVIHVGILQHGDKLIFTPMANLGPRNGFRNVSKEKIEVEINKGMAEIVNTLELALSKCE